MLISRIIFTITLILMLMTACAQPAQTSGNAVVTSNAESILDSKPDVPINVRLDGVSLSADEMVVSIFVQPRLDFTATYLITLTLPAEVQLLQGELTWEANLSTNDIFTRTITIATKGVTSSRGLLAASIRLDVFHLDVLNVPGDYDYSFGKSDWLYLSRNTDRSIEFSHDPYFGEPYCCPHGEPGEGIATAAPGGPTETPITETPGLPKFYVIQTMAPTLTWLATMSPPVTQPPGDLPWHSTSGWSPDGNWVAFVSARDGDEEIYALNVSEAFRDPENLQAVQLTHNPGSDHNPQWQPPPP